MLHRAATTTTTMSPPERSSQLLFLLFTSILLTSSYYIPGLSRNPRLTRAPIHVYNHLQLRASDLCDGTLYPDLCMSTLMSIPEVTTKSVPEIISAALNHTSLQVSSVSSECSSLRRKLLPSLGKLEKQAFSDCFELFAKTISELANAVFDLSLDNPHHYYSDLLTLLSSAMTNQYTCLDGFAYSKQKHNIRDLFEGNLFNISHHISNSLTFLQKLPGLRSSAEATNSDKEEPFPGYGQVEGGFPSWISPHDRKLLQSSVGGIPVNLTVAKDGSGDYKTVQEAVDAAPERSNTRFVIYVKAGLYFENVDVNSRKTMLMFVGDGIGQTWIKADRNVVNGSTTFNSATVAVAGKGFLAKGISFENYAGPSKHQAVALRSGSDFSAFFNCRFIAYQDTLYVHSLRQFYRDCDIYGTIDFIFGNAAVVFQNCGLYARKPGDNQTNVFTAQGRNDPNQNTGISILNCNVAAAADLIPVVSLFKTYLGRPFREFSRTVYMLSNMGSLIDPAGWLEWDGVFALSTLYYGEYNNTGPGSNTSRRVKWPGYRVIKNSTEAQQFTAGPFIQGGEWLEDTGFPYYLGFTG